MRSPDEYEAEFMGDGDDVVHREKLTYPTWFLYFLGAALTLGLGMGLVGSIQSGDPAAIALMAGMIPFMALLMLFGSTLRVTVTRDELAVQYGPIGPKIPIDRIELCEAENYSLWKYGGYGIRYSVIEGAWCYNMVGDKGKAVRIHYRTESGALKKVLVASPRHHALADAINRARIAKGHELPAHLVPDEVELGVDDEVVFADSLKPTEEQPVEFAAEEQEVVTK